MTDDSSDQGGLSSQPAGGTDFPRIDLHHFAATLDVDLDEAFGALLRLYEDIDERLKNTTSGLNLPCHRGCDMCCYESVFVTPLEFLYVWDFVQRNFTNTRMNEVIQDGLALFVQFRGRIEQLDSWTPESGEDPLEIARNIKFRCPLLGGDGGCSVYPVRELYARLFGSTFNRLGGIYGCHLVGEHLGGKEITLLKAEPAALRLNDLPLTFKRQVYPYYIHLLYGDYQMAA